MKRYLLSKYDRADMVWLGLPRYNTTKLGEIMRIMFQLSAQDGLCYRILESEKRKQKPILFSCRNRENCTHVLTK